MLEDLVIELVDAYKENNGQLIARAYRNLRMVGVDAMTANVLLAKFMKSESQNLQG